MPKKEIVEKADQNGLSVIGSGLGAHRISEVSVIVVELDLMRRGFLVHRPSVRVSHYDLLIRGKKKHHCYFKVKVRKVSASSSVRFSYHMPRIEKYDILALCFKDEYVGYHKQELEPLVSTKDWDEYFKDTGIEDI